MTGSTHIRLWAVLLALVLAMPRAVADPALARAKQYFDNGRSLYEQGFYAEAARRFSAGYELVHKPRFLLNMGQCYRQLKDLSRARDMFQRYLDEAPGGDPERPRVTRFIAEIDAEEAERARLQQERAAQEPAPSPQPVLAPSVALEPAPAPPHRSFARRHWWIFPLVGAVLAGAAVGIYFGVRPADPCTNTVGCLDLR